MIYVDVFSLEMSLVFKFKASMTSSIIIGSLQRPCNFDVSQCINSKFSSMGYFGLFSSKMLFVVKFKACMTS